MVDDHEPPILVMVHALTPLPIHERETVPFERPNQAAGRDIAEPSYQRMRRTYTVTATTGSSLICVAASVGTF